MTDLNRPLVMAQAKTVLGHALPKGHPLTVVDEPSAPGEVDQAMAKRLHASKLAGYRDELHATPVETPEQERNRLAYEALRDAGPSVADLVPSEDLVTHQDGPKAGKAVTRADLIDIARREGAAIETDDNKPDLIRKIMEHRAQAAQINGTNAETDGAGGQGDTAAQGSTGPGTSGNADSDANGSAHGEAGEGPSDAE